MSPPHHAPTYLRRLGITIAVAIGAIVSINAFIDPYGIFGSPRIHGLNDRKPQAAERVRVAKPYMAERSAAVTVIAGNSRPELGIDPQSPCWLPAQQPVFNAGIPGADLNLQLAYAEHTVRTAGARRIVIALDFLDFLVPPGAPSLTVALEGRPSESLLRLNIRQTAKWRLAARLQRLEDRLKSVFSLETFYHSVDTLLRQRAQLSSTRRADGFNPGADYLAIVQTEGQSVLFAQKDREVAQVFSRPGRGLYDRRGDTSQRYEALQAFLDWATQNQVDVQLLINPYHAHYLALIRLTGNWPKFTQWKQDLARIAVAREVPLWDFSLLHPVAIPSPLNENGRGTLLDYYWEPAHYRSAYGDRMLGTLNGVETSDCSAELAREPVGQPLHPTAMTRLMGEQTRSIDRFLRDNPDTERYLLSLIPGNQARDMGRNPGDTDPASAPGDRPVDRQRHTASAQQVE
jgi:hypothetical protein